MTELTQPGPYDCYTAHRAYERQEVIRKVEAGQTVVEYLGHRIADLKNLESEFARIEEIDDEINQ